MEDFTKENKELLAKALWMAAFEATLRACLDKGLDGDATLAGFFGAATYMVREIIALGENN
jgi:hypothetical protein